MPATAGVAVADLELEAVGQLRLRRAAPSLLQILTEADLARDSSVEPETPMGRKCAGLSAAPPSIASLMPS